ncbi:MAG: hypothetical protein PHD21_00855, partial [Flavobacteriales bacterium]|nr:hypothetical protein [Flavobacteriales bacterium]
GEKEMWAKKANIKKKKAYVAKGIVLTVSGVVRDVQATPVSSVEIWSVKKDAKIATTDAKGMYSAVVNDDDVIVFKKSGYADVNVGVEGQTDISVRLDYSSK